MGELLPLAAKRHPRHWREIDHELRRWRLMPNPPPAEVTLTAMQRLTEGKAKDNPVGYMRRVVGIEAQNWHESRAIQEHEKRKAAESRPEQPLELDPDPDADPEHVGDTLERLLGKARSNGKVCPEGVEAAV